MHNGTQKLSEHRESNERIVILFRKTSIGLNNISITFLIIGKDEASLETFTDAIEMIKHSIRGM